MFNFVEIEDDFYIEYIFTHFNLYKPHKKDYFFRLFLHITRRIPGRLPLFLNYVRNTDKYCSYILHGLKDEPNDNYPNEFVYDAFLELIKRGFKLRYNLYMNMYRIGQSSLPLDTGKHVISLCQHLRCSDLLGLVLCLLDDYTNVPNKIRDINELLVLGFNRGVLLGDIDPKILLPNNTMEIPETIITQVIDPTSDYTSPLLFSIWPEVVTKANIEMICDSLFVQLIRRFPQFRYTLQHIQE